MKLLLSFLLVSISKECMSTDSLRFFAIGDFGGSPDPPYYSAVEAAVAERMGSIADAYQTSFTLALGDNFYDKGVKDVEDKRFVETFEDVFNAGSLQTPWYILAGNHDHHGNASAEIAYSKVSKRWNFPYYYYTTNYDIPGGKSLDIVMLDTVLLCGNTKYDSEHDQPIGPEDVFLAESQWAWIEQQLESSKANYLLVAGHFPVWSIAEHGPTGCLVDRLDPLLYKYNVTAYLSGHDHNLQHLQTSKGEETMDYIVTGSADKVEYNTDHKHSVPRESSKFFWADIKKLGGFVYFDVTAQNLTVTFIAGDKTQLYQHVMFPRK